MISPAPPAPRVRPAPSTLAPSRRPPPAARSASVLPPPSSRNVGDQLDLAGMELPFGPAPPSLEAGQHASDASICAPVCGSTRNNSSSTPSEKDRWTRRHGVRRSTSFGGTRWWRGATVASQGGSPTSDSLDWWPPVGQRMPVAESVGLRRTARACPESTRGHPAHEPALRCASVPDRRGGVVALLPGLGSDEGEQIAERLRVASEDPAPTHRGHDAVALRRPRRRPWPDVDPERVMKVADRRMYSGGGRGRTCLSDRRRRTRDGHRRYRGVLRRDADISCPRAGRRAPVSGSTWRR